MIEVSMLDRLLAPVSQDDPAGPDMTYDPRRHEIEEAFDASVSIDTNGQVAERPEADWRRIMKMIEEQSEETKDFWLAVYLCRAGARAGMLDIVETGLRYLEGLIGHFWDEAHPGLHEYGVEGRIGACDTLTSFREFTAPMRATVVIAHPRHGSFSADDLQRFARSGDGEGDYGAFRAAMEDAGAVERLTQYADRFAVIGTLLRSIDRALADRAGSGSGTSFGETHRMVTELEAGLRQFLPEAPVVSEDVDPSDVGEDADRARTVGRVEAVTSRDDVVRVIELVVDYYRRCEPNSPVPLLLLRAREWVRRDFLEVLGDIVPNAVGEARDLLSFRIRD